MQSRVNNRIILQAKGLKKDSSSSWEKDRGKRKNNTKGQRVAVTSGPTARVVSTEEYPGGTPKSDPRPNTHANPEEEGCCGATGVEEKATRRVGGRRRTAEEDAETGKSEKEEEVERAMESSEWPNEARRAWGTNS
ncbi:hypothetical protein NDU88_005962 [Pleurodeles waltl]|uniref:Uncharacterized protein n=1 Tax=Pleurodeles waltl TaxID=8319 RepID=A0AAV7NPC5_PLEWA|nr:hypothetical protein NDU88_005962 [Pleurodeles waltl]